MGPLTNNWRSFFFMVHKRFPFLSKEQRQRRKYARALIDEIHHNLSLAGRDRYALRREALDAFLALMRGSGIEEEKRETMGKLRKLEERMKLYEQDVAAGYPAQTLDGFYERSYKPVAQEVEQSLREDFLRR